MRIAIEKITDFTPAELKKLVNQIGNTPIQSVTVLINDVPRKIHLKLESENLTGSMKDRTGYALIQHLEDQKMLSEESVIVESTSGNLGVALAFQCKARGYPFVAVIDPKTTQENIRKMEAFGATITLVQQLDVNGGYLFSRQAVVNELCMLHKNYVWTDQYSNLANPRIHYLQTGPEIYQQMNEQVDAVFIPVSTGGTLAGIGQFFREVSSMTKIVGVDTYGSVIFGDLPAPRKLTGIGSSRRSSFIHSDLYDTHLLVSDEEAFAFCRTLYTSTQIKVGGSSGATLAACVRYLSIHPEISNVVCLCADSGENYASSIFNDDWMQQQGIKLPIDTFYTMQK